MDPVTALALIASLINIVGVFTQTGNILRQALQSTSGLTEANENLQSQVEALKCQVASLKAAVGKAGPSIPGNTAADRSS